MSQPRSSEASERELLTVVIPCLNEQDAIGITVSEVLKVADELPVDVEVLLVDDGSTDGTRARMEDWAQKDARCRVLVNPCNVGVGRSLLQAFEHIPARSFVTGIPGDAEFVFDSIKGFLELRHDYDLVLGYFGNPVIRPLRRRLSSRAFTRVSALLYGFPYKYLNGMKLYRIEVFRGIEVSSGGHAFNAELLAKALLRNPRLRVGEAPFEARGRARGGSKAFRPSSISKAVREVAQGHRAVASYRDVIIEESERRLVRSLGGSPADREP